jgi:sulfite oxidase
MTPIDKDIIVHEGKIRLTGWAYSGGGHWPERVDISGDGGSIWYEVPQENMSEKYYYVWWTWWMDLPVDAEGWLELVVRCWDNSLNTQPTYVRSAWNWDLHVTLSCHRIKIYSVNKTRSATQKRPKALEERGASLTPITAPLPMEQETDEEYAVQMAKTHFRDPVE